MSSEVVNPLDGNLSVEEELKEESERTLGDWWALALQAYCDDNFEGALNYLEKVIDLEPEEPSGFACRADVYAEMGDYQEAFIDYAMALYLGNKEADITRKELFEELLKHQIVKEADRKVLLG